MRAATFLCVQIHELEPGDRLPWRETRENRSGFLREWHVLPPSATLCSEKVSPRPRRVSRKSLVHHVSTSRLHTGKRLSVLAAARRCLRTLWRRPEFRNDGRV